MITVLIYLSSKIIVNYLNLILDEIIYLLDKSQKLIVFYNDILTWSVGFLIKESYLYYTKFIHRAVFYLPKFHGHFKFKKRIKVRY